MAARVRRLLRAVLACDRDRAHRIAPRSRTTRTSALSNGGHVRARRVIRHRVGFMDLRVFTEPQQGATYEELLTVAKATEGLGFDAFFRSDHVHRIGGGDDGVGSTDAWTSLAGLARETSRIRLGTMVTSATFRLPGPLAISVAQVDAMSNGRVDLG